MIGLTAHEVEGLHSQVRAALDAGPFIDPVTVMGIPMSRRSARRIEREALAALKQGRPLSNSPGNAASTLGKSIIIGGEA